MCLVLSLFLSLSLFHAQNAVSCYKSRETTRQSKLAKKTNKKNLCLVSKNTCPDIILISTWHSISQSSAVPTLPFHKSHLSSRGTGSTFSTSLGTNGDLCHLRWALSKPETTIFCNMHCKKISVYFSFLFFICILYLQLSLSTSVLSFPSWLLIDRPDPFGFFVLYDLQSSEALTEEMSRRGAQYCFCLRRVEQPLHRSLTLVFRRLNLGWSETFLFRSSGSLISISVLFRKKTEKDCQVLWFGVCFFLYTFDMNLTHQLLSLYNKFYILFFVRRNNYNMMFLVFYDYSF